MKEPLEIINVPYPLHVHFIAAICVISFWYALNIYFLYWIKTPFTFFKSNFHLFFKSKTQIRSKRLRIIFTEKWLKIYYPTVYIYIYVYCVTNTIQPAFSPTIYLFTSIDLLILLLLCNKSWLIYFLIDLCRKEFLYILTFIMQIIYVQFIDYKLQ